MQSSTASSTPRTALPSTARPCANHRKTPASVQNLTTTPPSEPLKWSTGAAVRDHRNAVRDRSERCPQSIGITVRIRRNPQPWATPGGEGPGDGGDRQQRERGIRQSGAEVHSTAGSWVTPATLGRVYRPHVEIEQRLSGIGVRSDTMALLHASARLLGTQRPGPHAHI